MKLRRLEIHNYKSLRNVILEPAPLSVFVGPNAAGKSNFADALDFLGEVYRWDLESAVKKKGGFENICFRQEKRLNESIRFRVVLEISAREWSGMDDDPALVFDHEFELRARPRGIRGPFSVWSEELSVYEEHRETSQVVVRLTRTKLGKIETTIPERSSGPLRLLEGVQRYLEEALSRISEFELALPIVDGIYVWRGVFPRILGSLRVFQLSPRLCRGAGVPTPDPDLERFGGNLPAVIDYLKWHAGDEFEQLLVAMRQVMPSLESIETDFTYTKTLGLFLRETGVKHPWAAEDISDGTIQAIALLAATFDPRIPLLVIEEPENSVHPWAIRNFVQAFREASEKKQIFLTTHSPILIDQVRPEELWVVQRPERETRITPVLDLDPSLKDSWGQGRFTLSEYLDSGALPEAVPAAGS